MPTEVRVYVEHGKSAKPPPALPAKYVWSSRLQYYGPFDRSGTIQYVDTSFQAAMRTLSRKLMLERTKTSTATASAVPVQHDF